jgi:hypothetical protein
LPPEKPKQKGEAITKKQMIKIPKQQNQFNFRFLDLRFNENILGVVRDETHGEKNLNNTLERKKERS